VTRKHMDRAAGAPVGDAPAQPVTLRIPTHMAAPSLALVLREGPKPTRPRGRIPRVARLLALAHHFEELLATGAVETQAEIAELAKLTPARVTQIMNLLGLAPDIQEEIFFLPPVTEGRPAVTERDLRQVLKTAVWNEQRERWAEFAAGALAGLVSQRVHLRTGSGFSVLSDVTGSGCQPHLALPGRSNGIRFGHGADGAAPGRRHHGREIE
jgi:hypothetical protein